MQQYEVCCEIFNRCSNNQMRDVSFFDVETDAPEAYLCRIEPRAVVVEREARSDGTLLFDIDCSGLRKRYSFTPV
ncbi:MAG: hypothetical protein ACI4MR_07885 [Candidatus Aphodomorpha sp.]